MKILHFLNRFFPNSLYAGLFFIACSYIPHFLPPIDYGFWGSLFFGALYYIGGIFIAEYVIHKISGKPLLIEILGNQKNRKNFVKVGLIGAVPFSLAVCDFGGFWYFPYWSPTAYYVLGYVLLGWVFYFLFLTICYVAFKLALDTFIPQHNRVTKYYAFEKKRYKGLGVIGGWFAIMVITVGLQNARWLTTFNVTVNKPETPFLFWYWWIIAIFAWIILCEFVEYKKKRSSLLKDTIHGYFTPLIAVILCGVTLAITNEVQNFPINLWHYANYPWTGLSVYGVPLFVVVGWPLHIIAFIEFWRAFGEEKVTSILFANSLPHKRRTKTVRTTYKRQPGIN